MTWTATFAASRSRRDGVGVIDRLWLWSKRNPRLAAALGSTAAAGLAGGLRAALRRSAVEARCGRRKGGTRLFATRS